MAISTFSRTEVHSGPLPSPGDMAKYNLAIPDAAERIMSMTEAEAIHRQSFERREQRCSWFSRIFGQFLTFLIATCAIGGGIWLASRGNSTSGIATIVTAIAALSGMFFWQNRGR